MASVVFSKAVLSGLLIQGVAISEIAAITGLTQPEIRNFIRRKAAFTDSQLAAIERATGLTGGQLAVISEPSMDAATKAVFEQWAEVRDLKSQGAVQSRR